MTTYHEELLEDELTLGEGDVIVFEHMLAWIEREKAKGRPEAELTLDAFIAEETEALLAKPEMKVVIRDFITGLSRETWRAPAPRNPTLCIQGIPLPAYLPKAGEPEEDEAQVSYKFAKIKDFQLALETGRCVHAEDIDGLRPALQEALHRANGNSELLITEIADFITQEPFNELG